MEINTEMNKIFGKEMAKLFAETIPEEDLQKAASKAWIELNKKTGWGYSENSEIERLIREKILARLHSKVEDILKEPVADEILEKKAREIVEKARKVGEEAIIRDIANHMVESTLSVYGRNSAIVAEVLNELYIRNNN